MSTYQAYVVAQEDGFQRGLQPLADSQLPQGEVLLQIAYSGVNYKDALASIEKGGVIRHYPMVPGIDASGIVLESTDPRFKKGDPVIVTSYGFGVTHPGGFSEKQRVPADWVVPLPQGLSLKDAMILGTAGITAALALQALEKAGATPDQSVMVTGASGGVGSIAVAMLKQLGYQEVIAVTRKPASHQWLTTLGADKLLDPAELIPEKVRPLDKQLVPYVIDTVGGALAEALIPVLEYGGSMALCGNASGIKIQTTVLPFILRGVNLLGIDSVNAPMPLRQQIWQRLASDLKVAAKIKVNEVTPEELTTTLDQLLAGEHEGRSVVTINEVNE